MEEGVIDSIADGNIGSIMGIGFPAQGHDPGLRDGRHRFRRGEGVALVGGPDGKVRTRTSQAHKYKRLDT